MSEDSADVQNKALKRQADDALVEDKHDDKKLKTDQDEQSADRKYPKKKVAMLIAYSGKGYYGMQVSNTLNIHSPVCVVP